MTARSPRSLRLAALVAAVATLLSVVAVAARPAAAEPTAPAPITTSPKPVPATTTTTAPSSPPSSKADRGADQPGGSASTTTTTSPSSATGIPTVAAAGSADGDAAGAGQSSSAGIGDQQWAFLANLDVVAVDLSGVQAAFARATELVTSQRAALDGARQAAAAADAALVQARQAESDAVAKVAGLLQTRQAAAVAAYVRPPTSEAFEALSSGDSQTRLVRDALASLRAGQLTKLADEATVHQHELEQARSAAEAAAAAAADQAQQVADRTAEVEAGQQGAVAVLADVGARVESALAEADSLARIDGPFSAQLVARESALTAQLTAWAAAMGTSFTFTPSALDPAAMQAPVTLVTVHGFTVAAAIGPQLDAMLSVVEAAGITLGGYGYRDIQATIRARIQDCGPTDFDIWQKPSMQCSPPVARPGTSLHERGLALDFSVGGALLQDRSSAAFTWLAANAATYGFFNLPAEPWHWSVTGS